METNNKRHNIETIEDIFNCVNSKNVDNFLIGFNELIRSYVQKVDSEREKLKEKGINASSFHNSMILAKKSIVYIDDNKQENEIIIHK